MNGVDRKAIAQHIFHLAEQDVFKINVSALMLAEVHKKKGAAKLIEQEDEEILLFFEHAFINIIDVDRGIGEMSNRLCRQHGILPNDGIHIASALRGNCDVLLTWDDKLAGLAIPNLKIEYPRIIGQLPLALAPSN